MVFTTIFSFFYNVLKSFASKLNSSIFFFSHDILTLSQMTYFRFF